MGRKGRMEENSSSSSQLHTDDSIFEDESDNLENFKMKTRTLTTA